MSLDALRAPGPVQRDAAALHHWRLHAVGLFRAGRLDRTQLAAYAHTCAANDRAWATLLAGRGDLRTLAAAEGTGITIFSLRAALGLGPGESA